MFCLFAKMGCAGSSEDGGNGYKEEAQVKITPTGDEDGQVRVFPY